MFATCKDHNTIQEWVMEQTNYQICPIVASTFTPVNFLKKLNVLDLEYLQ
jgi:hypothetical protein